MQTLEYRTIDKSAWPRGPWDDEPDKRQWLDETTGLPCLIVRSNSGALCGYVGVPEGHPAHGQDYDSLSVDCHGGLTFAGGCYKHTRANFDKWRQHMLDCWKEIEKFPNGDSARAWKAQGHLVDDFDGWKAWAESSSVCLKTNGESNVWWIGFDCAHAGDRTPTYERLIEAGRIDRGDNAIYRGVGYVTRECESLAEQLAAMTAAG